MEAMTREQASKRQYLRSSFYEVYLVGPNGEREKIARCQGKSGRWLLRVLEGEKVQARMRQFPNCEELAITKKTATALVLSNGWRMEFGGTMLQEAV